MLHSPPSRHSRESGNPEGGRGAATTDTRALRLSFAPPYAIPMSTHNEQTQCRPGLARRKGSWTCVGAIDSSRSMQLNPSSLRIEQGSPMRSNATQPASSYNRAPISPRNECGSNQAGSALSHTVRCGSFTGTSRRDSTQLRGPAPHGTRRDIADAFPGELFLLGKKIRAVAEMYRISYKTTPETSSSQLRKTTKQLPAL